MSRFVLFLLVLVTFCFADSDAINFKVSYLQAFAQENPSDIKSREILLKHFYKLNDKKNILKYSKEIYNLNPNDTVLASILNSLDLKIKTKRLNQVLSTYLQNKDFIKYINLYQALNDTKQTIPNYYHVNALYCAVMSNHFKLAKKILKRDDLPMTPHLSQIMRILDQKLANNSDI